MSWRHVLKTCLEDVFKTSKCLLGLPLMLKSAPAFSEMGGSSRWQLSQMKSGYFFSVSAFCLPSKLVSNFDLCTNRNSVESLAHVLLWVKRMTIVFSVFTRKSWYSISFLCLLNFCFSPSCIAAVMIKSFLWKSFLRWQEQISHDNVCNTFIERQALSTALKWFSTIILRAKLSLMFAVILWFCEWHIVDCQRHNYLSIHHKTYVAK